MLSIVPLLFLYWCSIGALLVLYWCSIGARLVVYSFLCACRGFRWEFDACAPHAESGSIGRPTFGHDSSTGPLRLKSHSEATPTSR